MLSLPSTNSFAVFSLNSTIKLLRSHTSELPSLHLIYKLKIFGLSFFISMSAYPRPLTRTLATQSNPLMPFSRLVIFHITTLTISRHLCHDFLPSPTKKCTSESILPPLISSQSTIHNPQSTIHKPRTYQPNTVALRISKSPRTNHSAVEI